jgi:hypothetical protein
MARLCHDDVAATLSDHWSAELLERADDISAAQRWERSSHELCHHFDLPRLDRQWQTLLGTNLR